jgi:hypothetical protein
VLKLCRRKLTGEKNLADKNSMAGLEKLICLLAPLQWDGQGETNIFGKV